MLHFLRRLGRSSTWQGMEGRETRFWVPKLLIFSTSCQGNRRCFIHRNPHCRLCGSGRRRESATLLLCCFRKMTTHCSFPFKLWNPLFFCKWQPQTVIHKPGRQRWVLSLFQHYLWSRVQSIAEGGHVCFWGGVVCKFKTYFWPLGTQMGNSKALFNFLFAVWFFQFKLQKHAIFFLVFAEQVQLR